MMASNSQHKKLFAVLLGGRAQGCHLELHDIVFVVDNSLEAAYPKLVTKWFGDYKRVHIDSSIELDVVDGYAISLSKEPPVAAAESKFLYCVNFGGYRAGFFGELHEVKFYVGGSKKEIVARARDELCVGTLQQHCDDNIVIGGLGAYKDVDDAIPVGCVDDYYIHLTPTDRVSQLKVESSYRRLDVPEIMAQVEASAVK